MQIPDKYKPEISKLYDDIEKLQSESSKAFNKGDAVSFREFDDKIKGKEARLEKIRKTYTREVMGW